MESGTLVLVLLVLVILELIWIFTLHMKMKKCCDWLTGFHDSVVKSVTKCCGGNVDPTWPPSGPPTV